MDEAEDIADYDSGSDSASETDDDEDISRSGLAGDESSQAAESNHPQLTQSHNDGGNISESTVKFIFGGRTVSEKLSTILLFKSTLY